MLDPVIWTNCYPWKVKPKQEFHLKVKNFLPPFVPEPAIYIAKPTVVTNIPASNTADTSTALTTAKVVGNQSVMHKVKRGATATRIGPEVDGQRELRLADGQTYSYSTMSEFVVCFKKNLNPVFAPLFEKRKLGIEENF